MDYETLAAAAGRILPSEGGPGAAETRVAEYVAQALEHRFLKPLLPIVERGLAESLAAAKALRLSSPYFSTFMIKPARLIPSSFASLDLFQPVRRNPSLIISRSSSSSASLSLPWMRAP